MGSNSSPWPWNIWQTFLMSNDWHRVQALFFFTIRSYYRNQKCFSKQIPLVINIHGRSNSKSTTTTDRENQSAVLCVGALLCIFSGWVHSTESNVSVSAAVAFCDHAKVINGARHKSTTAAEICTSSCSWIFQLLRRRLPK